MSELVDTGQSPFAGLLPEVILGAAERFGLECDGRFIALNSYENRVYQVGIEDAPPVVAKFYRPNRWPDASILEEHAFATELAGHELPVAHPVTAPDGSTLVLHEGYRVALFNRLSGDWPELDRPGRLAWLGRLLGRMHAIGRVSNFKHRPAIDVDEMGGASMQFLLEGQHLPMELESNYRIIAEELLQSIRATLERVQYTSLRLHGDCHPGNVLWGQDGPAFVDLDDCRSGPAIQDFWMLVSGDAGEVRAQLHALLEGYELFSEFNDAELALVEALRSLRMIHYAAWLARRWSDSAFPIAFPWFGTDTYWRDHIEGLRGQLEVVATPPAW